MFVSHVNIHMVISIVGSYMCFDQTFSCRIVYIEYLKCCWFDKLSRNIFKRFTSSHFLYFRRISEMGLLEKLNTTLTYVNVER